MLTLCLYPSLPTITDRHPQRTVNVPGDSPTMWVSTQTRCPLCEGPTVIVPVVPVGAAATGEGVGVGGVTATDGRGVGEGAGEGDGDGDGGGAAATAVGVGPALASKLGLLGAGGTYALGDCPRSHAITRMATSSARTPAAAAIRRRAPR